jgi:hypothetical protein
MSVLDLPQSGLASLPSSAGNPVLHELLRPGPSLLLRALMGFAMLSSAGAGASLTLAFMDRQAPRAIPVVATPEGAPATIPAHEQSAIPHDVWAPFVESAPAIGDRPGSN